MIKVCSFGDKKGLIRQRRKTFDMEGTAGSGGFQQKFQLENLETVISVVCFQSSGSGFFTYACTFDAKTLTFSVWFWCLDSVDCEMTVDVFTTTAPITYLDN